MGHLTPGREGAPAPGPAPASWILAVGDELLDGHTADANSAWLAARLRATPFPCRRMVVVADRVEEIAAELAAAIAGPVARLFCCGGLGPTPDDVTLEAVARVFGVPLVEDAQALAHIEGVMRRMHAAGWVASPAVNPGNRKTALVPRGARLLRNRTGMAPPLAMPLPAGPDGAGGGPERWLFVLPGVPRELRTVAAEEVLPTYCAGAAASTYAEVTYRGVGESTLYPVLRRLTGEFSDLRFGSYPHSSSGELVVRVTGADPERVRLAVARLRRHGPSLAPVASPAR